MVDAVESGASPDAYTWEVLSKATPIAVVFLPVLGAITRVMGFRSDPIIPAVPAALAASVGELATAGIGPVLVGGGMFLANLLPFVRNAPILHRRASLRRRADEIRRVADEHLARMNELRERGKALRDAPEDAREWQELGDEINSLGAWARSGPTRHRGRCYRTRAFQWPAG